MQIIDLKQMQGHGSHTKGKTHIGGIGKGKETQNLKVFDVPTAEVILKWQRSLWEGDGEVVKRSGRDESIRVVIHLCMEAMLGISLYSYPYLKLAKRYVFLIISYVFSSTKLEKRTEQVLPGSQGKG
jgi:hypothetical protein